MSERIEGYKDTREENQGRTLKNDFTDEEKIVKLKEENLKLKQQLEFLKKMEFLARQVKQDKSKRQIDIQQLKRLLVKMIIH